MVIVCKERGKGKTWDMVKLSSETGAPIIYMHEAERRIFIYRAEEIGCKIPAPVKYGYHTMVGAKEAIIDNFDLFPFYKDWKFPQELKLDGIEIIGVSVGSKKTIRKWDIAQKFGLFPEDFTVGD